MTRRFLGHPAPRFTETEARIRRAHVAVHLQRLVDRGRVRFPDPARRIAHRAGNGWETVRAEVRAAGAYAAPVATTVAQLGERWLAGRTHVREVTREGNKSALTAVTRLIADRDVRKPGGVASI